MVQLTAKSAAPIVVLLVAAALRTENGAALANRDGIILPRKRPPNILRDLWLLATA